MSQFVSPTIRKSMGRWSFTALERYVRLMPNDVQILLSKVPVPAAAR